MNSRWTICRELFFFADALSRAALCSIDPPTSDAVVTLDQNALRLVQNKDSYCHYVLQWLRQRGVEDRPKMGSPNSKIVEEKNEASPCSGGNSTPFCKPLKWGDVLRPGSAPFLCNITSCSPRAPLCGAQRHHNYAAMHPRKILLAKYDDGRRPIFGKL